jgi:hypothetical protein
MSQLFSHIIDREQVELPPFYLPDAPGVVIASPATLRAAGHTPNRRRPPKWKKVAPGVFRNDIGDLRLLQVRQCGDAQSDHWMIEVLHQQWLAPPRVHALVCAFSGRPIWADTRQGAMRLAEHCYPVPRSTVAGRWALAY